MHSETIASKIEALREDVRELARSRRLEDQLADLLDALDVAPGPGETPLDALRRVVLEARAGAGELSTALDEIRAVLRSMRARPLPEARAAGGTSATSEAALVAGAEELAGVARALGVALTSDPDALRARVLDAIAALREGAGATSEIPRRPDGEIPEHVQDAIATRAKTNVVRDLAGVMGVAVPDGADLEAASSAVVAAWRERGRQPVEARPARGAGLRLDAVLDALGMEPTAWRSARPDALVEEVRARVGSAPAGAPLTDRERGLLEGLQRELEVADGLNREEALGAVAQGVAALKAWSESACEALLRLWSPLVREYPLTFTEPAPGRAKTAAQGDDLRQVLSDWACGGGLTSLDEALAAGEDVRDLVRRLCDHAEELNDQLDERGDEEPEGERCEALARAAYEQQHGAGSWVTADYLVRHDLTRAVRDALTAP